jgi:hypothetical protein
MDLKEWFEALNGEKIRSMKGEPETQSLDCKQVGDEKNFKSNLSIVLSGFSNAAGGICLWGVGARKNSEGIDCIESFPGVDSPLKLASRLNELTPQAVSPGVQGVFHKGIVEADGRGFVATYVPESEAGPHMARYGEDRYHQRIGQSFLRMEPFQIADMFGRRSRPVLEVKAFVRNDYAFKIRVANVGRGIAEAPFIQIWVDPPLRRYEYGIDGNGNDHLPYLHHEEDGSWIHAGRRDFIIHPGMSVLIGGAYAGLGGIVSGIRLNQFTKFRYKVGAVGVESLEASEMVKMY